MSFVNLHTHSDYSRFDGFAKIEDLVKRAKELGYPALGISDHGTTTGLVPFYKECKKQGIKPILGCEFYIAKNLNIKEAGMLYHLMVIAKNNAGYKNMLALMCKATENFYGKPRIDVSLLRQYKDGLIVTSACMGGILKHPEGKEWALEIRDIFGEDFYLEIQTNSMEDQKKYNLDVISFANDNNIPFIVTIDSHYVNKEDAPVHRRWLFLGEEKGEESYYSTDDYYLMDEDDVRSRIGYVGQSSVELAMKCVEEIVNKCNVEIEFGGQYYPIFPTPDPLRRIKDRCNEGWVTRKMASKPNHKEYRERALTEFEVLDKANYCNYFCIVDDIVSYAKREGIVVGLGRGSVVASLVSYLLGVTAIDPIEHNLIFERFAHLERITPPDVDLDFQTSRRHEIIDYIKDKYGTVYQVRTTNKLSDKGALQRAGQTLSVPPSEVDKLSKSINSLEELPDSELKALAIKFLGHIQNFGVHASCVAVFPQDPSNWVAIEKQGENFVAACADFHDLESQGILKLDILGLETLDVIDETIKSIKDKIDIENLPIDDKETCDMLNKGFTAGCFQIESNMMTGIVTRMHVKNVYDLSHVVALGRPGPLDAGLVEMFLKCRNGQEKIHYLHPKLEPVLKNTEGVIVYQEQIMQIARDLCGYTLGQADMLRRIIGRKETELMEEAINEFVSRGIERGVDEAVIKTIADQIVTFVNYGFNMGHSAAYGTESYITAYLKAHYPAEYMAALLNSVHGDKDKKTKYVAHCKELGIKVLPPDIVLSKDKCYGGEKTVRIGFNCISHVGKNEIPKDEDEFDIFMDKYHSINKRALESLVKAGCFYGDRNEMLHAIPWYKDKRKSRPELEVHMFSMPQEKLDYSDMETEVLGFTFIDKLDKYDLDGCDTRLKGMEVLKIKPHKTKNGDPMAFVRTRDRAGMYDMVIFSDKYKALKVGGVYIIRANENRIMDFAEAKRIVGA